MVQTMIKGKRGKNGSVKKCFSEELEKKSFCTKTRLRKKKKFFCQFQFILGRQHTQHSDIPHDDT
jgi:hypothetical protein